MCGHSKFPDQVEFVREHGFAVVEGLGHPRLDGKVLVHEINEPRAAHPLLLVLNLDDVTAQHQVALQHLQRLVQSEERRIVVALESEPCVGAKPLEILRQHREFERLPRAAAVVFGHGNVGRAEGYRGHFSHGWTAYLT